MPESVDAKAGEEVASTNPFAQLNATVAQSALKESGADAFRACIPDSAHESHQSSAATRKQFLSEDGIPWRRFLPVAPEFQKWGKLLQAKLPGVKGPVQGAFESQWQRRRTGRACSIHNLGKFTDLMATLGDAAAGDDNEHSKDDEKEKRVQAHVFSLHQAMAVEQDAFCAIIDDACELVSKLALGCVPSEREGFLTAEHANRLEREKEGDRKIAAFAPKKRPKPRGGKPKKPRNNRRGGRDRTPRDNNNSDQQQQQRQQQRSGSRAPPSRASSAAPSGRPRNSQGQCRRGGGN